MQKLEFKKQNVFRLFWLRVRNDPIRILAFILMLLLGYLVLAPIITIIINAVTLDSRDALNAGGVSGEFTIYNLKRALTSSVATTKFWMPLFRTVIVGLLAAGLAIGMGFSLAWLVVTTNFRGRKILASLLLIPYMLPSWTYGSAWLTIFKNRRQAGSPGFMESMGWQPPDWVAYGPFPIVVTLAMAYFPFAFLLYSNALQNVSKDLEEVAQIFGARRRVIFRRIIVPLLLPATSSAVLLTLSRTIGTFGTPYLLGKPVGFTMLSPSLYSEVRTGSSGVSAVIACVLALLGIMMVLMDVKIAKEWRRFVTIGGKGAGRKERILSIWNRAVVTSGAWAAFLIVAVVPFGVLLLSTLMKIPGRFEPSNFTLDFWLSDAIEWAKGESGVLKSDTIVQAGLNSLWISGTAAVICGIVGLAVGYVVMRLPGAAIGAYLRQVSFLPYLIPGIAFAAAFGTLFAVQRGPIPSLYGTSAILVLVMIVVYLPYASRAGISAMMQQGNEPEEAARVLGAGFWTRIRRIVIPLQKGALVTAVVLPFITGMKELSLVVMLVTPGSRMLTTESVRLLDLGYTQLSNAVILLVGIVVLIVTGVVQRVTGNTVAAGFGR